MISIVKWRNGSEDLFSRENPSSPVALISKKCFPYPLGRKICKYIEMIIGRSIGDKDNNHPIEIDKNICTFRKGRKIPRRKI